MDILYLIDNGDFTLVGMYSAFTPASQLASEEPEFFKSIPVDVCDPVNRPTNSGVTSLRNAVSILEEGCKKTYSEQPQFTTLLEGKTEANVPNFVVQCHIRGVTVTGSGRAKKQAKSLAAKEALRGLVQKGVGLHTQFALGSTPEAALSFIDTLHNDDAASAGEAATAVPDAPVLSAPVSNENWVGKLQELCQQNKVGPPIYEYDESGPPNDKIFRCVCKLGKDSAEGSARQKKTAKTVAACNMHQILQKGVTDMLKDLEMDRDEEDSAEDDSQVGIDVNMNTAAAEAEVNPKQRLKEILSDDSVFKSHSIIFKDMENVDKKGNCQVMLKVRFNTAGDVGSMMAFPGTGEDKERAEQSASRMALIALHTFIPVPQGQENEEASLFKV